MKKKSLGISIVFCLCLYFLSCTGTSPRIYHSDVGKSEHFPARVFPVPHTMDFEIEDRIEAEASRKSVLGIRVAGEKLDAPRVTAMGKGMTYYLERKAAWKAIDGGDYDGIYVTRTYVDRGGFLPPLYRREKAVVHGYGMRILSFDKVEDAERQNALISKEFPGEKVPQKGALGRMFAPFRYLLTPFFPFLLLMPD